MKEKIKIIYGQVKTFCARYIFVVTIGAFALWITFFDDFNLIDRFQKMSQLHELRETEKHYENDVKETGERLYELMSGKEELEKFAREQYYMKEHNEDIFLVILNE